MVLEEKMSQDMLKPRCLVGVGRSRAAVCGAGIVGPVLRAYPAKTAPHGNISLISVRCSGREGSFFLFLPRLHNLGDLSSLTKH